MDDMNPAMRDLFMGGEDEEVQDFTPPTQPHGPLPRDLHEPGARHAYLNIDIQPHPDGSATIRYYTNDRDGDGVPDHRSGSWAEMLIAWEEHRPSISTAIREAGGSRREPSGRIVTVYHAGEPT
jgi:hypothetical protein